MSDKTKQCKIFSFVTEEKTGFQIIMKNKKIYIQKQQDQTSFRLIKNTSSYLCEAVFNKNVKLLIEFQFKKKFFQPYLCLNIVMNNFVMNGVQIDSFSINAHLFKMRLFKGFYGKFYAALVLTEKLINQVDQMNNQKRFLYQNDIRNFSYLFENANEKILMLFSAIRAHTIYQPVRKKQPTLNEIQDELKQSTNEFPKIIRTELFDAIGPYMAEIDNKAACYKNISIGKEIGYYGGFQSLLPFLNLLKVCSNSADQLYSTALNQFLQLIKFVFQSKPDCIEKACQLKFFKVLANFLNQTKIQGFCYESITRLKEIYITLNNRMLRQKFIQQVVWGINFGKYLIEENFMNYIKFAKTFYNQDIESSLHAFDVTKIIFHIIQKLDIPDCCHEHTGIKLMNIFPVKNYRNVLLGIFSVIQNILLIKRSEADIDMVIKKIINTFGFTLSPCFFETFIEFLQNLFVKDQLIQRTFVNYIQKQNPDSKFYLYKCLSSCSSWNTKGKIIQFILRVLQGNFFDDQKRQKQMLTLCARYPTLDFLKRSSIKSKSQQNRDSVQYSQDKLSLNSATMHKLIIINPILSIQQFLLDDCKVIQVISNWAFSERVLKLTQQDHQNPGLLILMQLYKGSTYKLREKISQMIKQKMSVIRFSPQLMAWAIQCSLIAQFDLHQIQINKTEIQLTKQNFIEIITNYDFFDAEQQQQNNQVFIIKLAFSSVKSKYPDDIVKIVGNKLFFIICDKKMQKFVQQLKSHNHINLKQYNKICEEIVSNVFTFINQYYVIKGDGDQTQFDQNMAQIVEDQNLIVLEIMEKILQIFVFLATINDRKIIQQANAERNHLVLLMLFPQKQKQKEKVQPKKKCILLIKKYMMYIIELTQNSGSAKIEYIQEDLKNIFLLTLSFVQQKYYQYFYYPYQRHKNIDFQLQARIRKSVDQIKRSIYISYLDFIQLIQYIDERGDQQHKSFYQLMKPKRKHAHRYALKHVYPQFWKKTDPRVLQLLSLKRQTLRKQAQQKIQSHLILKKVSQACSNMQKAIAKDIFLFVQAQRKQSDSKQKKSVSFYKTLQSQKCRTFCQCEQQLMENRLKCSQEQKLLLIKLKQLNFQQNRQINIINKKTWNFNRLYQSFWANKDFYLFSQSQNMRADNTLHRFYQRQRSNRLSKFYLMPFMKIQAVQIYKQPLKQEPNCITYINQSFIQGFTLQKAQRRRTSDKIINGLQFIKKKVYSKIVKSLTNNKQQILQTQNENNKTLFVENVLLIQPMIVHCGYFKLQPTKICFCRNFNKTYQHISLFKPNPLNPDTPVTTEWPISSITSFLLRRHLLKQNSIELFLHTRESVLLSFHNSTAQQFSLITMQLGKLVGAGGSGARPDVDRPLRCLVGDAGKMWEHMGITEKWINYQIGNFQYLMCLNVAAGRGYCDVNQYPVMPWVFSQYAETKVKKNGYKYRDFSKNIALLGKQQRIKKYQQQYQSILQNHTDKFPIPHHFGFHYSNYAIILQYLIRINPYSEGARYLQGGKFDLTDRLFHSIPESHRCATSDMSDLRELIPEFFYFPEFLINSEEFEFGRLQSQGTVVNHVELPDGCLNVFDFIENHREGLQSKEVSLNLHKWIDLVFGFKNSGREAEKSMNTYHYLTYQANCDRIDMVDDIQQKQAMQSQMAYYGKTPSQLFNRPHPIRQPRQPQTFDNWQKISFNLNQSFPKTFPSPPQPPQPTIPSILTLKYCPLTKSYLLLHKSGKGTVFTLDKKQLIKIHEFSIQYLKAEGINMLCPTNGFALPVEYIEGECIAIGGIWGGKLLVVSVGSSGFELPIKHSEEICCLGYVAAYRALFSGAVGGELCKWVYRDRRIQFVDKVYCYSKINALKIDQDLKIVATCTQNGCAWLISIQQLHTLRVIKVPHPITNITLLKTPYYHLFLTCRQNHQYTYTLNGNLLQQAELQLQPQPQPTTPQSQCQSQPPPAPTPTLVQTLHFPFQQDSSKQKVIIQIRQALAFLKTPDMDVEERLEVGIGGSGFKFVVAGVNEIVVVNQTQMLVWRRPSEKYIEIGVSKSL